MHLVEDELARAACLAAIQRRPVPQGPCNHRATYEEEHDSSTGAPDDDEHGNCGNSAEKRRTGNRRPERVQIEPIGHRYAD